MTASVQILKAYNAQNVKNGYISDVSENENYAKIVRQVKKNAL